MRFFTVETLGPKRDLTPDGFLICYDVPIARTGFQLYMGDEVGLKGDPNGHVQVYRDPEEVFRLETIASANGATFTNDHPPDGVLLNPSNWKDYAAGEVQNPHRGADQYEDTLLADVVVKDPQTIDDILKRRKTEVSCGYDCDYEQDGPGRGRQKNIVINHLALVDEGRCGPRCQIQDSAAIRSDTTGRGVTIWNTRAADRSVRMAVTDAATRPRGRLQRFLDRARGVSSDTSAEELARLAQEAEELKEGEHEEPAGGGIQTEHKGEGEDHIHVHLHRPAQDQDYIESRENFINRELSGNPNHEEEVMARGNTRLRDEDETEDRANDVGEEMGGEAAAGGDVAATLAAMNTKLDMVCDILGELADAEAEEASLQEEYESDPEAEIADRRLALRDRKMKLMDRFRDLRRGTRDDNIEALPRDPGAVGNIRPEGSGPGDDRVESDPPPKLGTGDRSRATRDRATRDSSSLKDAWDQTIAKAEILAPGMRIATFDSSIAYSQTEQRLCGVRRRALNEAYVDGGPGRDAIEKATEGMTLSLRTATCDSLLPVFNSAAAIMAEMNRGPIMRGISLTGNGDNSMPSQIQDFNKRMRERFDKPLGR